MLNDIRTDNCSSLIVDPVLREVELGETAQQLKGVFRLCKHQSIDMSRTQSASRKGEFLK